MLDITDTGTHAGDVRLLAVMSGSEVGLEGDKQVFTGVH